MSAAGVAAGAAGSSTAGVGVWGVMQHPITNVRRGCAAQPEVVYLEQCIPWALTLVTLRGGLPALFPSLAPQSNYVGNSCSSSLASFQPF